MSTHDELRRIWGANYAGNLDRARATYGAISEDSRKLIDENNIRHVQALADMGSEAYSNSRHPDHARVSQSVQQTFASLGFADIII